MSVVSERQRQAGSGSAPVTPQGDLSPDVPTPSIARNPLRGSKCNCLHTSLAFYKSKISKIKIHPQMLFQFTLCILLVSRFYKYSLSLGHFGKSIETSLITNRLRYLTL